MKRVAALVLLLSFFVVFLTAEVFFLTHSRHIHDYRGFGGSCAACAQIQYAESLIKQFGAALINISFGFIQAVSAVAVICAIFFLTVIRTPVKLKTRMNR